MNESDNNESSNSRSTHDFRALQALLLRRRSTKSYRNDALSSELVETFLSTVMSKTPQGRRVYGSALARYDVAVSVVIGTVRGMAQGAYNYLAEEQSPRIVLSGDHRPALAAAALDAPWLIDCPAVLVLSADLACANEAFADQESRRGEGFCWLEAGLIAQTAHLCAAALRIGTVVLGGLDADRSDAASHEWLPRSHRILTLMPLGWRA